MRRLPAKAQIVLLFISVMSNASDIASVKGQITDPAGAVLQHAMIRIESWEVDKVTGHDRVKAEFVVYSGANGRFLQELSPGLYDVFVSSPAFTPVAKKIKIESGRETLLNVEMKFDPLVEFVE